MDLEQLALIIDMMKDASNGAFKFGMLWLLKGFILDLIRYGIGVYLAIYLVQWIKMISPSLSKMVGQSED